MNLETAAQRYEEKRVFYAWEVYNILCKGYHKTALDILRYISQAGKPMTAEMAAQNVKGWERGKAKMESRVTKMTSVMKQLRQNGLLRRRKEERTYCYTLSELGELVVACDNNHGHPLTSTSSAWIKPDETIKDWLIIEPKVLKQRSEGFTWKEIAEALDIKYTTLYRHFNNISH